jgi:hypothetical protein
VCVRSALFINVNPSERGCTYKLRLTGGKRRLVDICIVPEQEDNRRRCLMKDADPRVSQVRTSTSAGSTCEIGQLRKAAREVRAPRTSTSKYKRTMSMSWFGSHGGG